MTLIFIWLHVHVISQTRQNRGKHALQTLCLAHKPVSLTLIHWFGLALSCILHRFCTAWHLCYNFPVLPQGWAAYVHTQALIRKLISTTGCEILGAPDCRFQCKTNENCVRQGEGDSLWYQTLRQKALPTVRQSDISTRSREESREHHRKCQRGCVMLSLITAHVATSIMCADALGK